MKRVLRIVVAIAVFFFGVVLWPSRDENSISEQLNSRFERQLVPLLHDSVVDLTELCKEVRSRDAWLLFVVETELKSDNSFRRYFQTGTVDRGIFLEYDGPDQANLRVGVATPTTPVLHRLRLVRADEGTEVILAIQKGGVRLILNGVDQTIPWPSSSNFNVTCSAATVFNAGSAECPDCRVTMRYASGKDSRWFTNQLDEFSNVRELIRQRWIGSTMALSGLGIVLVRVKTFSRLLRRLGRSPQDV